MHPDGFTHWNSTTGLERSATSLASDLATLPTPIFTPDGHALIVGLGVEDVPSGTVRRTLEASGDSSPPSSLAITADGEYLASWSSDSGAERWNLETGDFLGQLDGRDDGLTSPGMFANSSTYGIAFTPDGRNLYAFSDDSESMVRWSFQPDNMSTAVCKIAGRNLSRAEWASFVGTDVPCHATCPQWQPGT